MSNISGDTLHECATEQSKGCVRYLLRPAKKDLGAFTVRRALPTKELRTVGPWVFFDHMGPASFEPGEGISVRPHPHIGIATVTYLFDGEILHRDSLGSVQAIRPGDINLMVAGKGIVHSERERDEVNSVPHTVHGLQLWLALPEDKEEIDPAFYHYPGRKIPDVCINDVRIRVMMGAAYGVTSPVKTFSNTLYVEADIRRGQTLELPEAEELGIYVASGSLKIGGSDVPEYTMAVAERCGGVSVSAMQDSRIAMVGGDNLGERFIEWNFVSSRKERIEQAKREWKEGRFPKVPGDEKEFIPLPE